LFDFAGTVCVPNGAYAFDKTTREEINGWLVVEYKSLHNMWSVKCKDSCTGIVVLGNSA
jgi:hypothetical protein